MTSVEIAPAYWELVDRTEVKDPAVVVGAKADDSQKFGGIDLDPRKLDLQIKRDGNGVPLSVDEQDWSKINIQGFVPVIYKIEPVNMPALLGFNDVSLTPAMAT